jgi:hypothetical protein
MTRSNEDRMFANAPSEPKTVEVPANGGAGTHVPENMLQFITPTEMVDLPSRGVFYPEGHALYNRESIEIRHMTAKEEDILTTSSLLRKGVALDKMLQNIIVDKKINVEDMLIGDKNALLVYSRIFGYGNEYEGTLMCPSCSDKFQHSFDLNNFENKDVEKEMVRYDVEPTVNNTFMITLPRSKYVVEFRFLTSKDERKFTNTKKALGSLELLETIILAINDQNDRYYVKKAIKNLPIMDASIMKRVYAKIMPDIDLTQYVECPHCGEGADMGVPLDANFFWPDV